jgi:hypothetical protein
LSTCSATCPAVGPCPISGSRPQRPGFIPSAVRYVMDSGSAAVGCPPSAPCLLSPETATTGPTGGAVWSLCDCREASACLLEILYSNLQEFRYCRVVPYLYIFWASPSVLNGAVRFCIRQVPRSTLVPHQIQSKF